MGRSVSYPSSLTFQAQTVVAFDHFEAEDEYDSSHEWEWFRDDIAERMAEMFPSLEVCNEWIGREDYALLENGFAYMGVSEYCGLVSIWICPKNCEQGGYGEPDRTGLQLNWLNQVSTRFVNEFGSLFKLGTMSNGISTYRKVA